MWKFLSILVLHSLTIIQVNSSNGQGFPTLPDLIPQYGEILFREPPNLDDQSFFFNFYAIFARATESLYPNRNEIPLVNRHFLIGVPTFDAIAPYTHTAVGIFSNLGRRPSNERTMRNKNIAQAYCLFRVFNNAFSEQGDGFHNFMKLVGLDPDDTHESKTDPIGIGNSCGRAINAFLDFDGMNSKGDVGAKSRYNHKAYEDYTNYKPVNTHDKLVDPRRWQPAVLDKNGIFSIQTFMTPQHGNSRPVFYKEGSISQTKPHGRLLEGSGGKELYKNTTDEIIAISAALTDEQKIAAEYTDDKLLSLVYASRETLQRRNHTIDETAFLLALHGLCVHDTGIAIWKEKRKWDAVRPFSAIKYLYGDRHITAYCGKGKGTCNDIPASDWASYMPAANHPEYPSASAAICASKAEASRLFYGSDETFWRPIPFPQGSSKREPGITPRQNLSLHYPTWTSYEIGCGSSRLWGGVHFADAVEEGKRVGREVGRQVYKSLYRHIYPDLTPAGAKVYKYPVQQSSD